MVATVKDSLRQESIKRKIKPEVTRVIQGFVDLHFAPDIWGNVELEGGSDFLYIIVAGYSGKERKSFLATVSLTHIFAPYAYRIEEMKTVYNAG